MASPETQLQPLPYHEALAEYLSRAEAESWTWFASAKVQSDYLEEARLDLLRQCYRLEASAYPDLFRMLGEAVTRLTPGVTVTLYQSQRNRGLNASIRILPGEAHIVFEGGILQLLTPAEILGVLGHELAHHRLWTEQAGRFLITERLAQAMAGEARADPSHLESARLLQLYTEIYADRGALVVTGDATAVISGLLKIHTGLPQVDVESYARQADEVFARAKARTEELSHPELFIRTRALRLWQERGAGADAEVARMIEGEPDLDKLDLRAQERMAGQTHRWLKLLLREKWFQTDTVRAHARLFFPDFEFAGPEHEDPELIAALKDVPVRIRDYFCFLLLDFAVMDPELEDEPLKATHRLATLVGWGDRLEALSVKELKLKKAEAKQLRAAALDAMTGETMP